MKAKAICVLENCDADSRALLFIVCFDDEIYVHRTASIGDVFPPLLRLKRPFLGPA